MKTLWIVNKCCGALQLKRFGKKSTSGLWLDAMIEEARAFGEDEIVVVNIEKTVTLPKFVDGNVTYYTLEGASHEKYDYKSEKSVSAWREIIEAENPDLIEIWGTEFPYALAALKAADGKIPSVVFIQGILDSIGKYYLASLTDKEIRTAITLRDVLTGTTLRQIKKGFEKRAEYEKEILRLSGHIIAENQWTVAYCSKACPDVKTHHLPLSISQSFLNYEWSEENMTPHTIMCAASNYSVKGLHMLLKALCMVKKKYPDVKLFVPGLPLRKTDTLILKLKQNGYERLIAKMIKELDLVENVTYTGTLVADEMAERMSKVNCFAVCSSIENHSSTLKEAMTVGAPCVSSFVGGIGEYAKDGENCLLHRFEDYEVLANNICRIFDDKQLRQKLSANAKETLRSPNQVCSYEKMRNIFVDIVE